MISYNRNSNFHSHFLFSATSPKKQLSTSQTIVAGAAAGLIELLVMYPLDVVKTRAQLLASNQGKSASVLGSLRAIVQEGGVSRLYRGIAAPAIQEPIKRSVKFTSNSYYSSLFPTENLQTRLFCGALAGGTEAVFIAPFEVVKVRMQAANRLLNYNSSWHCFRSIIQTEGILSFASGVEAAIWRSGVWNGNYFGIVWYTKKNVLPLDDSAGKIKTMARNFVCGFIGGTWATVMNNPFDVAVSRIRNVLPGEDTPYRHALQSLARIVSDEGFLALYKGFAAKVLRLGPGGGIMMCAFDFAKSIMLD